MIRYVRRRDCPGAFQIVAYLSDGACISLPPSDLCRRNMSHPPAPFGIYGRNMQRLPAASGMSGRRMSHFPAPFGLYRRGVPRLTDATCRVRPCMSHLPSQSLTFIVHPFLFTATNVSHPSAPGLPTTVSLFIPLRESSRVIFSGGVPCRLANKAFSASTSNLLSSQFNSARLVFALASRLVR